MAKDYYQVLGVSRTASDKDIKSTYRKLARKYHPDVNPGDKPAEERFKDISEAYEVLSNPELRKKYDQYGHLGEGWRHVGEGGFPGGGFPGGGGAQWQTPGGSVNPEDLGINLEDLLGGLGGMFGGRGRGGFRPSQMATRGDDLQQDVEITLEEAYHGGERAFRVQEPVTCPACRGAGVVNGRPCGTCHGARMVMQEKTLTVKIPRGAKEGGKLRLPGKGAPGQFGGQPGDLFLVMRIAPHPRFERKGDDLYTDVSVTFPQAALGAEVTVQTMDGAVATTLPGGTSSGQSLRLRGKGMPKPDGTAGDLYARVKVMVPKQLSARERELIEELQKIQEG